jgi:hypothetical protein
MKKQTSVEWLIDEHFGGIENCTPDFRVHIQQAKEMEKRQIEKAWDDGDYAYFHSKETGRDFENGEEYYNETYGK